MEKNQKKEETNDDTIEEESVKWESKKKEEEESQGEKEKEREWRISDTGRDEWRWLRNDHTWDDVQDDWLDEEEFRERKMEEEDYIQKKLSWTMQQCKTVRRISQRVSICVLWIFSSLKFVLFSVVVTFLFPFSIPDHLQLSIYVAVSFILALFACIYTWIEMIVHLSTYWSLWFLVSWYIPCISLFRQFVSFVYSTDSHAYLQWTILFYERAQIQLSANSKGYKSKPYERRNDALYLMSRSLSITHDSEIRQIQKEEWVRAEDDVSQFFFKMMQETWYYEMRGSRQQSKKRSHRMILLT